MQGGASFEEVLAQQLGAAGACSQAPSVTAPFGTAAAYGFFFCSAGVPQAAGAGSRVRPWNARVPGSGFGADGLDRRFAGAVEVEISFVTNGPAPDRERSGERGSRPGRRLTCVQREALDALVALGADLPADFTDDQLRSAFRALALTYHPDRHPACGAEKTEHLSGVFRRLSHAYHLLRESAAGC